jgi:hypothetical protein
MDSAAYEEKAGDGMDSGARDGEGHRGINVNKNLIDNHRGGRNQDNITAIGLLVLPTWEEVLFVLLPPTLCLLKLITATCEL